MLHTLNMSLSLDLLFYLFYPTEIQILFILLSFSYACPFILLYFLIFDWELGMTE